MNKLLSVPPNLKNNFHNIIPHNNYYCNSDPVGNRIGSAGGTSWLLNQCWKDNNTNNYSFEDWLKKEDRIIIHAGGQGRRTPAYSPLGKILTPIPVFRWERGQHINQTLLDLSVSLYEDIMEHSNENQHVLIGNGDVYIQSNDAIKKLPDTDIVCYGMWVDKQLASRHGVFICDRNKPEILKYMLQKPSVDTLLKEEQENLFLMDIGIWVLSDKAVKILMQQSNCLNNPDKIPDFYDLYSQFGMNLGSEPNIINPEINNLSVSIVPLNNSSFYHFGTSSEIISSTLKIQNSVIDQREILLKENKKHPSIFTQNSDVNVSFSENNSNIWIENSYIPKSWKINNNHLITGVPENSWSINLPEDICIDIVPINKTEYALRLYHINDSFRGTINDNTAKWLGTNLSSWVDKRKLSESFFDKNTDIQELPLFPVVNDKELLPLLIKWILGVLKNDKDIQKAKNLFLSLKKLSAEDLSNNCNLIRLFKQKKELLHKDFIKLKKNFHNSVFYQVDLKHLAKEWVDGNIGNYDFGMEPLMPFKRMQEWMFRSKVKDFKGLNSDSEEKNAFDLLKKQIVSAEKKDKVLPKISVLEDQIIWGRSPVRIDLAGGWTDTPPYCLINGGNVVNMAINLNGQPPIQVFIKRTDEPVIILRSIDLGTHTIIKNRKHLQDYENVGSEFSISKAALCLCGFAPDFCSNNYSSLQEQLNHFGGGIDISTLAAIPKGSGLGTSSVLSATVLGTLAQFCGLNWDKNIICQKTICLEQMLTTGGGWQDQYGGIFGGIKLIDSKPSLYQKAQVRWTSNSLFESPEYKNRILLYYTGITRTAKTILSEIVKGMFLNSSKQLRILKKMKDNANRTFDALGLGDTDKFISCLNEACSLKQQIDKGCTPDSIKNIVNIIEDLISAYILPGAGGGGYLFFIAKDSQSAGIIRERLTTNPPNKKARFVDMEISDIGLQITKS